MRGSKTLAESTNMGWANGNVLLVTRTGKERILVERWLQICRALISVQSDFVKIEVCDVLRQPQSR